MSRFGDDERNSRKQMLSTLGGMASGAFLLFLIFFIIFAQSLKATPDYVPQADAIVVFTGTSPVRIETGLELLAAGKGRRLLVSGVYQNQSFDTILGMAERMPDIDAEALRCCIDLDYRATNTVANTQETALWAEVHGFSSLIIVTSSQHMPRAFLELRPHHADHQPVGLSGFATQCAAGLLVCLSRHNGAAGRRIYALSLCAERPARFRLRALGDL
jgi:vancomycin permeability regulator SanA